jgi:capsular exopolysaccharide synthesis family protein
MNREAIALDSSDQRDEAMTRSAGRHSGARDTIVVLRDPESIEAEAIRGLRTRIMAQHVREGRRALALCSPSADTGCTFVATNLAAATAQIGIKTVLVDADLRSPAVDRFLSTPAGTKGLGEFLSGEVASLDDVLQATSLPSLSVVTAGAVKSNPQELLASSRFKTFVDHLLREFDLTIFDTTATNGCTDAQRVATVCGYSLIVARKHQTHMKDVSTLAGLLRADRSTVVGTVLNDF